MSLRSKIESKIQEREHEIAEFREKLRAIEGKIHDSEIYIGALRESLALIDLGAENLSAPELQEGSKVAKARDAIKEARKPLHINDILREIGDPIEHSSRASLVSSISRYVKKGAIFQKAAPNTFGLIDSGKDADS